MILGQGTKIIGRGKDTYIASIQYFTLVCLCVPGGGGGMEDTVGIRQ